jgi:hypothetical protein
VRAAVNADHHDSGHSSAHHITGFESSRPLDQGCELPYGEIVTLTRETKSRNSLCRI